MATHGPWSYSARLRARGRSKEKKKEVLLKLMAYVKEEGRPPTTESSLGQSITHYWGLSPYRLLEYLDEAKELISLVS